MSSEHAGLASSPSRRRLILLLLRDGPGTVFDAHHRMGTFATQEKKIVLSNFFALGVDWPGAGTVRGRRGPGPAPPDGAPVGWLERQTRLAGPVDACVLFSPFILFPSFPPHGGGSSTNHCVKPAPAFTPKRALILTSLQPHSRPDITDKSTAQSAERKPGHSPACRCCRWPWNQAPSFPDLHRISSSH